jgi:hypothetical protein
MANIFTLENFSDFSEKINIDELYEKKRQIDLSKLELFKKILNRIHVRIKTTSKHSIHEKFCWFVVPEIIIGVPKYDQAGCIAYLMNTLQENGFNVRYFHPNTLFICWEHWVPSYVRSEIKKKTGIIINEYGERIEEETDDNNEDPVQTDIQEIKNSKKYTPINSYKPSGKLVYSEDLLNKISKLSKYIVKYYK